MHNGNCPFCKHGQGIHPGASDRNGRWHGPFTDPKTAYAKAYEVRGGNARYCKKCLP